MTSQNPFKGVFTPVITCFTADDSAAIDEAGQRAVLNYLFESQLVDGIVACASTGEGVLLSDEEYWKVAAICLEECKKRKKIAILATTHFRHDITIKRNHEAKERGFDAVLITPPPYVKPDQKGTRSYFDEISRRSNNMSIFLYNVWYRTGGKPIDAKTIIELARYDNIVGIKDCGVTIDHVDEVIEHTDRKTFAYLCGEDTLYFDYLMHGGDGAIGAPSHIVGKMMQEMLAARDKSDLPKCQLIHRQIKNIISLLFSEPNPSCFKAALAILGVCKTAPKYPVILPASDEAHAKLDSALKMANIPRVA